MESENVDVRPSSRGGVGVFALKKFRRGEKILGGWMGPELIKHEDLPEDDRKYLQVSKEYFTGPAGNRADFVNHSCSPNAGLREIDTGIVLVAIDDIEEGEEVVFDYSTYAGCGEAEFSECRCGSLDCRGVVGDFALLPQDLKERYLELGIVAQYLRE